MLRDFQEKHKEDDPEAKGPEATWGGKPAILMKELLRPWMWNWLLDAHNLTEEWQRPQKQPENEIRQ